MNHYSKAAVLYMLCLSSGTSAFVAPSRTGARSFASTRPVGIMPQISVSNSRLYSKEKDQAHDDEITRLRAMAAKLRAEAAELEAEKVSDLAKAAEKAFEKFDVNKDGEISTEELKAGLEKTLKIDLTDDRVNELMREFDASGDGALQLDEFVTVDKFRNKLEALAREEKRLAQEAALAAKREEEQAAALEARIELLNDSPPTTQDKLVSILPYLFPLMDGLQFGRFLLEGQESNPLVGLLAVIYGLYRSVPFSGFIVFFLLNFLSANPTINRLVRFNMQQAIFLDIALFFPGLIASVYSLISSGLGGGGIPPQFTVLGTDVIFVTLLATVAYCAISSGLGFTPDKIPFISQAVIDRMPTAEWFDENGQFIPRELREEKKKDEDKKDD